MRNHKIAPIALVLSVFALASPLLAQELKDQPQPTCNHCPATYIPKSELDAYTQRAIEHKIVDQQELYCGLES